MKLRNPIVAGIFLLGLSGVCSSALANTYNGQNHLASNLSQIWVKLDPAQKEMVDLLAADFFQKELSSNQRGKILADARSRQTGSPYASYDPLFKSLTQNLPATEIYNYLSEEQKAPFRIYAIDRLGLRVDQKSGASSRQSAV